MGWWFEIKRQTTFYGDVVLVEAKKDAGLILLTIETGSSKMCWFCFTPQEQHNWNFLDHYWCSKQNAKGRQHDQNSARDCNAIAYALAEIALASGDSCD